MKHTLLLGESSALFIEENKLFNKKTIKFDEFCNLGIDDVRILSNRADVEFKIGFLPKVHFWQSNLVLKSYVVGNTFSGTFFNSYVHKNTLEADKYRSQDITMSPDDITKNVINQMAGKRVYGIEHLSLVIPKIINTSKYWIFLSENLLGKYSIYCGKGDFVLFTRTVDNILTDEVSKTTEFLARFGFKNGDDVDKLSIMREPVEGFKNIHKGYGDEYLVARVFEQTEKLGPLVGPQNWKKPCCLCNTYSKAIIVSFVAIIVALIVSNVMHYKEYTEIDHNTVKFAPKILTLTHDTNNLLRQARNSLREEINDFDFLDDEFRLFQATVDDAILYDTPQSIDFNYMRKRPRRHHMTTKVINNSLTTSRLEELKFLFPKDLKVNAYTYESSNKNNKERCNIVIYTDSSDEIISQFITNVKGNATWVNEISVDRKNPSAKIITISKK